MLTWLPRDIFLSLRGHLPPSQTLSTFPFYHLLPAHIVAKWHLTWWAASITCNTNVRCLSARIWVKVEIKMQFSCSNMCLMALCADPFKKPSLGFYPEGNETLMCVTQSRQLNQNSFSRAYNWIDFSCGNSSGTFIINYRTFSQMLC